MTLDRLPELAERWGCTVQIILQSAIAGQLQICYPVTALSHRTKTPLRMEPIPGGRVVGEPPARGYAAIGVGALQMIEAGEAATVLKYDFNVWRLIFEPPLIVRLDDLCVFTLEVVTKEWIGAVPVPAPALPPTVPEPSMTAPLSPVEEPGPVHGPSSMEAPQVAPSTTRSDPLALEIEAALDRIPVGSRKSVHAVFAELAKVAGAAGTCVISVSPGLVHWRTSNGGEDRTDISALKQRLRRLARKAQPTND